MSTRAAFGRDSPGKIPRPSAEAVQPTSGNASIGSGRARAGAGAAPARARSPPRAATAAGRRGETHRRGDAASSTRASAREGGNQGSTAQRVVGQGHRGSGLGSGRLPRDETRGGGDATADAPSRSLKTATPGSRDLARGDARDRVRSRSRRATQPSPSLSEFADSHRHTVSLKNASRFFWGSCDWMPIRVFHVGSRFTKRDTHHTTHCSTSSVFFGVSRS